MTTSTKTFTNPTYIEVAIAVGIIAIIILNLLVFVIFKDVIYFISSNGSPTFSILDDKIGFVIDNNLVGDDKIARIYGFGNSTEGFDITFSDLVEDDSGKLIESRNVLLNNTPSLQIRDLDTKLPKIAIISIENIGDNLLGLYQGYLFVNGQDDVSVPITLEIRPNIFQIMVLIIDGIAIAVAFWKIIKFVNARYDFKWNSNKMLFEHDWTSTPLSFRKFFEKSKITSGTVVKNVVLDIGSILFGMVVGLITLLDNTFVTDIHELDINTVVVLLGIGLGIGSLKEYVYQASEPSKSASG